MDGDGDDPNQQNYEDGQIDDDGQQFEDDGQGDDQGGEDEKEGDDEYFDDAAEIGYLPAEHVSTICSNPCLASYGARATSFDRPIDQGARENRFRT